MAPPPGGSEAILGKSRPIRPPEGVEPGLGGGPGGCPDPPTRTDYRTNRSRWTGAFCPAMTVRTK